MKLARLVELPLDRVFVRPQIRGECRPQAVAELAESIRVEGVRVPIRVQPFGDDWSIVDGEHRYRAAKELGLASIPALVEDAPLTEAELVQEQVACNSLRVKLSPLDLARAIERRMKLEGLSAKEVGKLIGKSEPTVCRLRTLLQLTLPLQQAVQENRMGLSVAYAIASTTDAKERAELSHQALKGGLTREKLEAWKVNRHPAASGSSRKKKVATFTVVATGDCSVSFASTALSPAVVNAAIDALRERITKATPETDLAGLGKALSA